MNKKGVYTPEQISDNTDYYWNKHNSAGDTTVDKETAKKIIKDTCDYLSGIGSGKKWDDDEFESCYKGADPFGLGKNLKAVVVGIITKMSSSEK